MIDRLPPAPGQLIFCAGPPRSGTTLLNRLLCESDRAGPFLPECSYLTRLVRQYADILAYSDKERFERYFGSTSSCTAFFSQCVQLFLDRLAATAALDPALAVVLKDPELALCANELLQLLPAARLVFIVRDPRDVLASLKVVRQKQGVVWRAEAAIADLTPFFAAASAPDSTGGRRLLVKYEDIVQRHPGTMAGLGEFVGYAVPETIDVNQAKNRRAFDRTDPFYSPTYEQDITGDRMGAWKTTLTDQEARLISQAFAPALRQFGYVGSHPGEPLRPAGSNRWY